MEELLDELLDRLHEELPVKFITKLKLSKDFIQELLKSFLAEFPYKIAGETS